MTTHYLEILRKMADEMAEREGAYLWEQKLGVGNRTTI